MKSHDPELLKWPMHMALAVIGDKWKLIIVCRIRDGLRRFGENERSIPTISPKMLTQQLRELERDGIVTRTVFAEVPPRVEYHLTPVGEMLQPVADEVWRWGRAYIEHTAGGNPRPEGDRLE